MNLENAMRQMIDELYNSEVDRHPMYSDGYNDALRHMLEFIDGYKKRQANPTPEKQMLFDKWWATITPKEQQVIGIHNAKFVWQSACEELADAISKMPFGDTGASFVVWIREQK